MVQEEVEGLTLLLGCMLGVLTACLMVTMAGCLICPWCPAYRRRRVIKHKSESSISSQYPTVRNGDITRSYLEQIATH